jgi:hypothetical protein
MIRDWRGRWDKVSRAARAARPRREMEPADIPDFEGRNLASHEGLAKHESSLITQIRTGKIGLRAFLFYRRVPDVETPLCECGTGRETALHVTVGCPNWDEERESLRQAIAPRALSNRRDFSSLMTNKDTAKIVARWFLSLGIIGSYRLAEEIQREREKDEEEEAVREREREEGDH